MPEPPPPCWTSSTSPTHVLCFFIHYYFQKVSILIEISLGLQLRNPFALKVFDEVIAAPKLKQIVMFLDYVDTFSSIVDEPEDAVMCEGGKNISFKMRDNFVISIKANCIDYTEHVFAQEVKKLQADQFKLREAEGLVHQKI